jgi:ferredoxin--NADP+ reductase
MPERYQSRVIDQRPLSEGSYELILDRCGMEFQAGKEIQLHGTDPSEDRNYSIASGEQEEHLHLIYRVIPEGLLTPKLEKLRAGDPIAFTGPFGSFVIRDFLAPMIFIATGTGIAPALSFMRSHPGLNLTLLHGVRHCADLYHRELFAESPYEPCISGESDHAYFKGRVTDRLADFAFGNDAHFYLCGANEMILQVHHLLKARDVGLDRIFSEAYYFWK